MTDDYDPNQLVVRMKQPDGSWLTLKNGADPDSDTEVYPGASPAEPIKFDFKIPADPIKIIVHHAPDDEAVCTSLITRNAPKPTDDRKEDDETD